MKLMVVGSNEVYSIENFYIKYFKQANVNVEVFFAQSMFYSYYQKNIFRKLLFKAGLSFIYKRINLLFKNAVEAFNPDIIWVFKGMEISAESLKWAKSKGIKLVNYNPDNPFIFTGKGSGNRYITESIPLYDLHFTYNLEIQHQLEREYNIKTAYLPFGFDISDELYNECVTIEEINKICFLGNPDNKRAAFLKELVGQGISVDIYGNSWERFISGDNIKIYPPVYGNELWKVLRRYRGQLNMMRIHNVNSHNMRTFEVPGIGGIMVAPKTVEHDMFFKNGEEIFLYNDVEECALIMKQLLVLSNNAADKIRVLARNASLERGYRYEDRAIYALEVIKSL